MALKFFFFIKPFDPRVFNYFLGLPESYGLLPLILMYSDGHVGGIGSIINHEF